MLALSLLYNLTNRFPRVKFPPIDMKYFEAEMMIMTGTQELK